jgi:hypothetical protein
MTIQISAKKQIDNEEKSAVINYDFGETLEEASKMFGAEVVFTNFRANAKITAQAAIRRMLEKGMTQEQIQEKMAGWKPGVAIDTSVDPLTAMMAKYATMSPEDQKKFIEDLKKAAVKK